MIVTAAGQEAQVDYGTGLMVRDTESRKYRRTLLFVMKLGGSRKSVRLLTFRFSSRIWAELHERAFRRLSGATRIVVLDNLREVVLVRDMYDPALNPLYRDVLAHKARWPCPAAFKIPTAKAKSNPALGMRRKHHRKACASRLWKNCWNSRNNKDGFEMAAISLVSRTPPIKGTCE